MWNYPDICRTWMFVLVALWAFVVPVMAEDLSSDRTVDSGRVAGLIRDLSSNQLQDRVAAEQRLLEIGPGVLDALPDPSTLSPSTADAIRRIRTRLEQKEARDALEPSFVSLHGQLPLEEALAAIATQTGNPIDTNALPISLQARMTNVDFEQTKFWEAIRSIEEQIGTALPVALLEIGGPATATVDGRLPASQVVGPFRVRVLETNEKPDFQNPRRRILRLTLDVAAEPRLRPLFVHIVADDITVARRSSSSEVLLPPLSPQASLELPAGHSGAIQFRHDVLLPEMESNEVASTFDVRGAIDVEVATVLERFVFRRLNEIEPRRRRRGGVTVSLEEVRTSETELKADLRIRYDADGPIFESYRSWVFHNDIWLSRGDDRDVARPKEFSTLSEGQAGVWMSYRFALDQPVDERTQIVYLAPSLVARVPIAFEFEGLRLENAERGLEVRSDKDSEAAEPSS